MYSQIWDPMEDKVSASVIMRDADQAYIPMDPGNMDYQEYLAWVAEGNEPTPYTPPAEQAAYQG